MVSVMKGRVANMTVVILANEWKPQGVRINELFGHFVKKMNKILTFCWLANGFSRRYALKTAPGLHFGRCNPCRKVRVLPDWTGLDADLSYLP